MKKIRRLALYVALPLACAVAVGYGWYRLSDTGKGWRYEEKLATYCDGLIPYEQSAVFTDLNTEDGLPHDTDVGVSGPPAHYCEVGDLSLTIARVSDGRADSLPDADLSDKLRAGHSEIPPMALGGGWHGYTDLTDTGVVLACGNKDASVAVSALSDESHANRGDAREVAELVAATAVKAADRWSCEAEPGGPIPPLPAPAEQDSTSRTATGTCRGVSLREPDEVHWFKEAKATGTAPLERCVLGETLARSEDLYHLQAAFGPYAQLLRATSSSGSDTVLPDAGHERDHAWASATCPGHKTRALFTIRSTEYAHPEGDFLRVSLREFAERSAKQRGCTDLELPD